MSDPLTPSAAQPQPPEDEFAGVRARAGRHPALALGAAALALFIIFHVRADISYALSSAEPIDLGDSATTFGLRPLGDASATFAAPPSPGTPAEARPRGQGVSPEALAQAANHYVKVRGTPDRESALELDTKGSWVFTQFFRILGTGSRLFVHRRENPLPAVRAEEDRFEGRLIRFADLSFEHSIREYTAAHVIATHFFAPDVLRRAVAQVPGAPAVTVGDVAGDPVLLGPNDLLAIDVNVPEQIRISFPPDKYRHAVEAQSEIEKRGGSVLKILEEPGLMNPTAESAARPDHVVLLVRFPPEKRQAALGEIGDIDPKIQIRDERRTLKVRLSDLHDGGDALLVQSGEPGTAPERLPVADIPAIRTLAAVQIPADAWMLIEMDHPRDHVQSVIFAGVLLAFAAINLIGLARGLRRS